MLQYCSEPAYISLKYCVQFVCCMTFTDFMKTGILILKGQMGLEFKTWP